MTFLPHFDQPISAEVDRLIAWAMTIEVEISIDFDVCADVLHIPDLRRDTNMSSTKGHGKLVLDAVIALADGHELTVEIEHMTDEYRLGEYYRSFGFVPYGGIGLITNLHRLPAGPSVSQAALAA